MDRPQLARDIMVTKLVTVSPQTDIFDGIHLLLKNRITGAPVIDDERRYLGMLSESCCISVLTLTAREANESGAAEPVRAREFMTERLITLKPEMDAFEAIGQLLRHRISGAPVVDDSGRFQGVFSERYSMRLLVHAAYDQAPSSHVGAFMNTDKGRLIDPDRELLSVARMFLDTYYRRLPVVENDRLIGQISRRDVLAAEHHLSDVLEARERALLEHSGEIPLLKQEQSSPGELLESTEVAHFMDTNTHTISPDTDLLSIAQIFLNSNRRRLPVLEGERLVGQISRRDVLRAAHARATEQPHRQATPLYLSATGDSAPAFGR